MLIIKSGSKMMKNSKTSYDNGIHRVDSPSSEDSKNINFFCLISGEGQLENLRKMTKHKDIYGYAN